MLLTSLIRTLPNPSTSDAITNTDPDDDPADIFTSALGSIFPDDAQNMHGNPGSTVVYESRAFGDIRLNLADPVGEDGRRLFAHYLWNAGLLVAELVGERVQNDGDGVRGFGKVDLEEDEDEREFRGRYRVGKMGDYDWSVKGEKVLELGAGSGLAGIAAGAAGASQVAITDYPDPQILKPIQENIDANKTLWTRTSTLPTSNDTSNPPSQVPAETSHEFPVQVQGHAWGTLTDSLSNTYAHSFTRVVAADTLWLSAQHENLARSMDHFLSLEHESARVWVVAGFHTGRERVSAFFKEIERQGKLEVEDRWEVDTRLNQREWKEHRDTGGGEDVGERKKWLVVATLRRRR